MNTPESALRFSLERRITSGDVIEQLFYLFVFTGAPAYIRSDNGPEFTAKAVRRWLNHLEVTRSSLSEEVLGKMGT